MDELPPPYSQHSRDGASARIGTDLSPAYSHSSTSRSTPINASPYLRPDESLSQDSDGQSTSQGGIPYLISGPPPQPPPSRIISYRMEIPLDYSPDEFEFPPAFSDHGIHEQDWLTFRNCLFPTEALASISRTRTEHCEKSRNSTVGRLGARTHSDPGSSRSTTELEMSNPKRDSSRRGSIQKVFNQWNTEFFEPRGLLLIAMATASFTLKRKGIDSRSVFKRPALAKAVAAGDVRAVRDLLQHGADPDIRAYGGPPPLYQAACNGHSSIVELLLQYGVNVDTKPSTTQLVASRGDKSLLAILLKYGADPTAHHGCGSSLLFEAVARSDVEIMRLLLSYGAEPNHGVNAGNSPLYHAILKHDKPVIQLLLDHGADVNIKPPGGLSPLYIVAGKGDARLLRVLLEHGAIVDESPPGCPTALYWAMIRQDVDVAQALLLYGADGHAPVPGGGTIASHAREVENEEIGQLFS